jgi:hypothetical protein
MPIENMGSHGLTIEFKIETSVNFKVHAGPFPFDCQGIRAIRNMPDLAQGPHDQEAEEKVRAFGDAIGHCR